MYINRIKKSNEKRLPCGVWCKRDKCRINYSPEQRTTRLTKKKHCVWKNDRRHNSRPKRLYCQVYSRWKHLQTWRIWTDCGTRWQSGRSTNHTNAIPSSTVTHMEKGIHDSGEKHSGQKSSNVTGKTIEQPSTVANISWRLKMRANLVAHILTLQRWNLCDTCASTLVFPFPFALPQNLRGSREHARHQDGQTNHSNPIPNFNCVTKTMNVFTTAGNTTSIRNKNRATLHGQMFTYTQDEHGDTHPHAPARDSLRHMRINGGRFSSSWIYTNRETCSQSWRLDSELQRDAPHVTSEGQVTVVAKCSRQSQTDVIFVTMDDLVERIYVDNLIAKRSVTAKKYPCAFDLTFCFSESSASWLRPWLPASQVTFHGNFWRATHG